MSMHWKALLAGAALAAAGLAVPWPAAAATSANLILNGNAETGLCTTTGLDTMTIPGWQITSGGPDTVCYGASGYPTTSEGPPDAGNGFFAGGSKGNASMQQVVSVSSGSAADAPAAYAPAADSPPPPADPGWGEGPGPAAGAESVADTTVGAGSAARVTWWLVRLTSHRPIVAWWGRPRLASPSSRRSAARSRASSSAMANGLVT